MSEVTPQERATTLERVSKCRAWFITQQPFFATLTLQMNIEVSRSIPTAGVSYTHMYFNPDFVATLKDEELRFLLAHEVFHPMLDHNSRRGGRNKKLWNVAGDYVINEHLCLEGIGIMPAGGLRDSALFAAGNGNTEEIYSILEKQQSGQQKSKGQKGDEEQDGEGDGDNDAHKLPWEDILDPSGSPSEQAEVQSDMKVRVAAAAQVAKMAGKLSANMKRLIGEAMTPKLNWRDVLRDFITKARTDERSFARPNRRFASAGIIMPSISGEQMGEILVAVDCSGSIGERELNEFAAEIRAIHDDVLPIRTQIVYFDSRVSHHDTFERGEQVVIAPHGGGGTAFSPIFAFADKKDISPVCCVVLTDLYCSDFGPEPDYPVLWVTNGTDKAPWGRVIKM